VDAKPDKVVVLRDGVGRGQEPLVLKHEVGQVRRVIEEVTHAPADLTFALTVKRIKQSMVAINHGEPFKASLASQQVFHAPAGAVISDPRLLLDPEKEFFLFSLGSSPSTARAVHYRIVSQGSLTKEALQEFAYALSHVYPNWAGPVLVPAMAQYAHTAAKSAAEIFKHGDDIGGTHQGLLYL